MQEDVHDLQEVVLFPNMDPPIAGQDLCSRDELLDASKGATLPALREWLRLQLAQLEGQARKQSGLNKPPGLTPEVAAYIQARETQLVRKASKDAYMKALQKLDYLISQIVVDIE